MLSKTLFHAARSDLTGPVVRFTFSYLSPLLPVRRLVNTREVIGFVHPRPSWDTHVLLVPKMGIPSLMDVTPDQVPTIVEILRQAKFLGRNVHDGVGPMSLLVNGGRYQDVGQIHFHLICSYDVESFPSITAPPIEVSGACSGWQHPQPQRPFHYVFQLGIPEDIDRKDFLPSDVQVRSLLQAVRDVVTRFDLLRRGFFLTASAEQKNLDFSCFHLASG